MLIDIPGMRELGNMSVGAGMEETFSEIMELSQDCKFGNCSHTNRKGCAILSAIKENVLSEQRYKNHIKMKNESAFNEMSYFEKGMKDREFGELINSIGKSKCR
jgi:ribosome biogenesis GTPase